MLSLFLSRSLRNFGISLIVAGSAHAASAQATLFTNRNTFNTAVGSGMTAINFGDAVTSGTSTSYSNSAGLTLSGVNFVGNVSGGTNYLYALSPSYFPTYSGWNGNPSVLQGPSGASGASPGSIVITLPSGVTAVGMDIYTAASGDNGPNTISPIGFTLSTGQFFTVATFGKPTLAFAGFQSTAPITSITIQDPTGTATYPNLSSFEFKVGSSAAAPEPGSIALLALSALPALGIVARRRVQGA